MSELQQTIDWFKEAIPNPTIKNLNVQLGVHVEEFAEMLEAFGLTVEAASVHNIADALKQGTTVLDFTTIDKKEVLDAICDQYVTGTGIAHMLKLNSIEGLKRVNESNYSKFVNGKAIFDENGKIKKGPGYFKPSLDGLY